VREAGFVVEQHVDPDLPPVLGDLAALSRCLQNLVGNAVKYGGSARWVGISAKLQENAKPPEIAISVQDRGMGIAKSEITHIFEPFYRSPAVSAAQIHGTGLGLPLSRSIAEAMGGKLTVQSKLGAGSTFTLHLPVARGQGLAAVASAPGHDKVIQE
jgi:signal transduction histidine kinase